ncbi:MAG TPA: DUF4136 domain-containing protein [Steroidobacteraceae bacterium]|jgi:hypothetical protein
MLIARNPLARSVILAGFMSLLTACATPEMQVRVQQAEEGLPKCKTFAWHVPPGDVVSLTAQRVRSAVMVQLETKGYGVVEENADCRIAYFLRTREIPKAKPGVGIGVGGGSRGVGGGIGVSLPVGGKSGYAGTFTLDVIDAAKNVQVWSGSVDVELEGPDLSEEDARKLAEHVLSAYPDAEST